MPAFKSFLKKNFMVLSILAFFGVFIAFSFIGASNTNTSGAILDSITDTTKDLTDEEIRKIIEDLKAGGDIEKALKKFDELAQYAELKGDSALKDYAIRMKNIYEYKSKLASEEGMVGAMTKKNSEIATVDKAVRKALSVKTIVEDLRGAVSDECLFVLESLTEDQLNQLQDLLAEIENLDAIDLNDIFSMSITQRSLLDILVLNEIIKLELIENSDRLRVAKDALSVAVTISKSYEKQDYVPSDYAALVTSSESFSLMGKKAKSVAPEQVVLFQGPFKMKKAPIMYNGHILVAIEDLYQYIEDASINYMYDSANMVIQSEGKVLEISAGKNIAYINDVPKNMPVPVLSFNKNFYMSVETFAECYDISYRFLPEHEFVILYQNLLQLKNTAVPNQINRG